jgi:formate dehydrogenase
MVPHMSGTSLDAQIRYANGTLDILDRWDSGKEQEPANVIVIDGDYASKAYGQREAKKKAGDKQQGQAAAPLG